MTTATDLGIEILVRLASKGEIDPWDVDIIEATDRCLQSLDATNRNDLRLCGRTLHCATILLRLKAEAMAAEVVDALSEPVVEAEDWEGFAEITEESANSREEPGVIDLSFMRRKSVRQPRHRRVTLSELIAELQRLETAMNNVATPRSNTLRHVSAAELRAKTIGLAHAENIESDAKQLAEHLAIIFRTEQQISFSALAARYQDVHGTFLAILFLAHWGMLDLVQEHFYTDISIHPAKDDNSHEKEVAA
ncbi:MAG: segregation/condensation protein A [Cyanobacteria bacterium NC_groundwater_1444_Ag_S-0.65um_54_12]|nr:segregation/condensation protein A [Cyanobacteria bacterium NC_groundwater_1444_Ag_S-0.65um_54_12]